MTNVMIDGSLGEGGGQILRTALGLSMVTGQPFRIERIRAGREKPGLLRQHLTAVNAAVAISSATVDGAVLGSQSLSFAPGKVKPGEYTFSIGSAGSTTLVLQTILPALLTASGASRITLEGGTHNPFAPPFDFLERAFLPLVNRMGPTVNVTLERAGFFPAGGGRLVVDIQPVAKLTPLHILARGETKRRLAKGIVASLPGTIAKRELAMIEKRLGWTADELQIRQLPAEWGPGNLLSLEIESDHITEVFTGFGMKSMSAEAVGETTAQQARQYLKDNAPVGTYLADQLLIPCALAGAGSFLTQALSSHSKTNIEIVGRFLPTTVAVEATEKGCCLLKVSRR